VARFDVAVDDALVMGGGKPGGDLGGDAERLQQRQRPALDLALERLALAESHGDEQPAVVGPVGLEDGADVGVLEARGGASLAGEAPLEVLAAATVRGEELDRRVPLELEVPALVHHPHAAASQAFEDAVMGDRAADQRRRRRERRRWDPRVLGILGHERLRVRRWSGLPNAASWEPAIWRGSVSERVSLRSSA